jgi:16S rRNA (adenine1518-N6/adenine1519-N6)-dimethyltransferase
MHIPKKSLGQNFLLDRNLCKKIVTNINIKNKNIIEIGPGTGLLTNEIIKQNPKKLILLEKDNNLYETLKLKYLDNKSIEIKNIDVLKSNLSFKNNFNIIANLPYNISTKLIIKLLIKYKNFKEMVFLVQKEVSDKFKYKLLNKKNKYSLFLEIVSNYQILHNISNKVFYPKPKVKSTLIKITPKNIEIDKEKLWIFSNKIFMNKRKKINNKFNRFNNQIIDKKILEKRPEDLNKSEYLELFNLF